MENGNSFIPTSVITYFSPVIKVEELVRTDDAPDQDNPMVTIDRGRLADDKLLDLITSFHEPKVNLIKCGYCGIMSRNLTVHVKLNHKKNKSFGFGFSGLGSQEKNVISSETFEAGIRHKKSVWVRRAKSRLELSNCTT